MALLYTGYGYQVRFVEYTSQGEAHMGGNDPADRALHEDMAVSFDWSVWLSAPYRLDVENCMFTGLTERSDASRRRLVKASRLTSLAGP